jgi:hypothetical protein
MILARLCLLAAGGTSLLAFGQNLPPFGPIPADRLELPYGQTRAIQTPDDRAATLQLLARARDNYALRGAGRAFDLKSSFHVSSGGQTSYDGDWTMEDIFEPALGSRWTARTASYQVTRISANGMLYGDDPADYVPLRLQEARAALFDPIPSAADLAHATLRSADASFNGVGLTCVLISGSNTAEDSTPARRWDETEECIDPRAGLLHLHSQTPGRYSVYEYADSLRLAGYIVPRKITITEGGNTVSQISVESLTAPPSADPALFKPTDEMKQKGRPVTMSGAQKLLAASARVPAGAALRTVCILGVVTPAGQLAEAHSLQPSDPHSAAALEAARKMTFPSKAPVFGTQPQQHFVFIFQSFASR